MQDHLDLGPADTDLLERLTTIPDVAVAVVVSDGDRTFTVTQLDGADELHAWSITIHNELAFTIIGEEGAVHGAIYGVASEWRALNFIPAEAHLVRWRARGFDPSIPYYRYAERIGHPGNGAWIHNGTQISESQLVTSDIGFEPVTVLLTLEEEFMRSNRGKR